MKKLLLITAMLVFGIGNAYAMPIMLDLGAAGLTGLGLPSGDTNHLTGVFDELSLYVETTSTPTGGANFIDVGDIRVDGFNYHVSPDSEGITNVWELTGRWDDLIGQIVNTTPGNSYGGNTDHYIYTSGTLFLYASNTVNSNFNQDFSTVPANEGSSDDAVGTFIDGTHIATLSLLNGVGSLDYDSGGIPQKGSTDLYWKFTSALDGFWLDQYGSNLYPYVLPGLLIAITDTNTDEITIRTPAGAQTFYIDSLHDGSAKVDVVPEPASLALLGIGAAGLALIRRKKVS